MESSLVEKVECNKLYFLDYSVSVWPFGLSSNAEAYPGKKGPCPISWLPHDRGHGVELATPRFPEGAEDIWRPLGDSSPS